MSPVHTDRHTLRRAKNGFGYETKDGRYRVYPAFSPSLWGGSVSRPSYWLVEDQRGEYELTQRLHLADIRDLLKARAEKV